MIVLGIGCLECGEESEVIGRAVNTAHARALARSKGWPVDRYSWGGQAVAVAIDEETLELTLL